MPQRRRAKTSRKKTSRSGMRSRRSRRGASSWRWLFSGMMLGVLLTGGLYVYDHPMTALESGGGAVATVAKKTPKSVHQVASKTQASAALSKKRATPHFEFYQTLSHSPSVTPAMARTKKPSVAQGPFTVRVAAFQKRAEAEALSQRLKPWGIDAKVSTAQVKNQTWFRVVVPAIAQLSVAEKWKELLALHGIESTIVTS